jgi:hypothetical protein
VTIGSVTQVHAQRGEARMLICEDRYDSAERHAPTLAQGGVLLCVRVLATTRSENTRNVKNTHSLAVAASVKVARHHHPSIAGVLRGNTVCLCALRAR